jgi:hypothetical protein
MRVALGTRLRTGEACTQTGIWRVLHVAASSTSVINGQAMPSYAGHSVIWNWWMRCKGPAEMPRRASRRRTDTTSPAAERHGSDASPVPRDRSRTYCRPEPALMWWGCAAGTFRVPCWPTPSGTTLVRASRGSSVGRGPTRQLEFPAAGRGCCVGTARSRPPSPSPPSTSELTRSGQIELTGERLGDAVAWVWTGRGQRYAGRPSTAGSK